MRLFKFNEQKLNFGRFETEKYGKYNSIQWLNQIIHSYINKIYEPFGFKYGVNSDIDVNGKIINSEYISKMVNNYTIFKTCIRKKRIFTENEFYEYMTSNLHEIYHYEGVLFSEVLSILINTTRKGNLGEKAAFLFFEKILSEKGFSIKIDSPTTEEDISGIDGKFSWKNKVITIQVKPYKKATVSESKRLVKVFSQGSLSLGTDYLILNNEMKNIIVKAKDVTISGNYFLFQEDKIIAKN